MKLKNKKTGEIKEFVLFDGKNELQGGATLKDLVKEWEDVSEEPKGIKVIYFAGATVYIEMFNQKEAIELEEKLKAWKRLKDKGFKVDQLDLWRYDDDNYQERIRTGRILFSAKDYEGIEKDLYLLFGDGE